MSTTPDPTPGDPIATTPTYGDATTYDAPTYDAPTYDDAAPVGFEPVPSDDALPGEPLPGEPLPVESTPLDADPIDEPSASAGLKDTAAEMREADLKVLYAVAGFSDVLVGAVRSTVSDSQVWARARLAELRFRRAELARQAEEMRRHDAAAETTADAETATGKAKANELQEQVSSTYDDLASRGQRVVNGVRSSALGLTTKAERRAGGVRADVVNRIDPAFDKIQERIDAARRAVKARATTASAAAAPAGSAAAAPAADAGAAVPDAPVDTFVVDDVVVADAVVPGQPDGEFPSRQS